VIVNGLLWGFDQRCRKTNGSLGLWNVFERFFVKKKGLWVGDWKKLWDELVQVVVCSLVTKLIIMNSKQYLLQRE
jgi:hypothetical protein